LPTVGALGGGAAGPVFLQVGTACVEPACGHTYDPTDGATTDPRPAVPACPWVVTDDDPVVPPCAKATVLETTDAVASTIVVSFMAGVLSLKRTGQTYAGNCPCKRESLLTLLSIQRELRVRKMKLPISMNHAAAMVRF
jgi:hypothetical protein